METTTQESEIVEPIIIPVKKVHFFGSNWSAWGPVNTSFKLHSCLSDSTKGEITFNVFKAHSSKQDILRQLSSGAKKILGTPNAGGSSIFSEAMSFEILNRFYNAQLLGTELEIEYDWGSKITDYSCKIGAHKLGVSVTRLIDFGDLDKEYKPKFSSKAIQRLLEKKLHGVLASTSGVFPEWKWEKQILHIFATSYKVLQMLEQEYPKICPSLRSNTMTIVTVVENAKWIF